jgi:hypothetical protein
MVVPMVLQVVLQMAVVVEMELLQKVPVVEEEVDITVVREAMEVAGGVQQLMLAVVVAVVVVA